MTHTNRWLSALLQVAERSIRPARRLTVYSVKDPPDRCRYVFCGIICRVGRLVTWQGFSGTVYWVYYMSLDKPLAVSWTGLTGSSSTRLFLLLEASNAHPSPTWTLGASSRNLYKLCFSRFYCRHNPSHAGTHRKSIRLTRTWKILLSI